MISSASNQQIKELVRLQKNARYRKREGCFAAEGIKLVREACSYGKLKRLYISETFWEEQKERLEEEFASVIIEVVTEPVFRQIADTITPQGILGLVQMPEYSLEKILNDDRKLFLLLDNLRDPGNLGTIIRTAEGAGMSGILLNRECVDIFNPKVVRSTMGAIFRVPFLYVDTLEELIPRMKQEQIAVYGTWMEGSCVYDSVDYCRPSAIVIGNEANGISHSVMEQLSGRIRIPMEGHLESLNAAVAAAVVMYEAARQRRTQ